jgi:hypothetical protein
MCGMFPHYFLELSFDFVVLIEKDRELLVDVYCKIIAL